MATAVLAFALAAMIVNVMPGLDTFLVLRTSIAQGRRSGLAAALGILTGCGVWGLATAVGLTALLTASQVAYDVVRVCGAAYLVWLGTTALWRARRKESGGAPPEPAVAGTGFAAFRAGVGTNLLNPKAGVFYMSLVPQFMPHGAPVFGTTVLFTVIDLIELAVWFWLVSGAAAALGDRLRRPSFRRRMEQVSGVAFIGFAANLLADRP
ncbi:LysE family translocator [Actinomadura madurae]|uniref:LysE family translocator n=1 Tax=Actinomadura madurae TaxID=1993 RepID=UPI002026489C|nr:LysE family translocator [Actinomadura madurae]URN01358.1 LysE family translocator [Actinomadura madurae]URN03470.1 LysE family translocator [Actinomadura madurae]